MLQETYAGLRVCLFLMVSLMNMRDNLPFSVDSELRAGPVKSDAVRYKHGEIWWHENREEVTLLTSKIRACDLNSMNATRVGRRLGCFIQRTKLRARRQLTTMTKNAAQYMVEQYRGYCEALSGPNAWLVVCKLILSIGSTALGIGKLIYHRQFLMNIAKHYVEGWVSQYLPKTPEPPSSSAAPVNTAYISSDAHTAFDTASAQDVSASAGDDEDNDEDVELIPLRSSPRVSPTASPSGSPRDGVRAATDTDINDPTPSRGSPRRPPYMRASPFANDNTADRIDALDDATARVMSMLRGAGLDGPNPGMLVAQPAEPLAKKRVAFKDEVVDAEMANRRSGSPPGPRRPVGGVSSSTPPQDDPPESPPSLVAEPRSPPLRPSRAAQRGRAAGVGGPGRRPLTH